MGRLGKNDIVSIEDLTTVDIERIFELADTFAVYQSAARLIAKKYNMRPLSADEGGLAPIFPSPDAMFSDAVEAIQQAGLRPGEDVALAVDVAGLRPGRAVEDRGTALGGDAE